MTLFQRFCRIFRVNPWLVRMLMVFTVSGGCVLAFSEAKPENGVLSDSSEADSKKKKMVVLGTGWAGINFLKTLKNPSYDVQVISPRNYFVFTPLLPSVTCGTLEPRSIVEPVRNIVRKKNVNIHYWEAECFKIDAENKKVYCRSNIAGNLNEKEEIDVDYDYLVIAIGAPANTFNIPGVAENCHFLKLFAEEKFQRDGIDVKTGAMVVKVSDKEILVKNGGGTSTMPYGMVVWATGIGTRPIITEFMKQIGQGNRRALLTDEWLRVEGCDDKDKSGTLTVKEFQEVLDDIRERYPQVALYLKNKHMRTLVDLLKDSKGDAVKGSVEVNLEEFKSALSQVDSQMKNLPPTAQTFLMEFQVAAQQGTYLADCFNRMEKCERNPEGPLRFRGEGRHRFHPFRYKLC
ncbi:UNVERIFIED_CONTAM: External alternative NAD(P)H-ubiquinone oxidoreductase B2, mitochondrial [Sesamum radiatum]|uniref:NADH:ubiquinone reductase (non-electrogenic) n=1 Tax=Sesamum radiatum TaxID=300843 RepID=A0AAW2K3G0_SESRA